VNQLLQVLIALDQFLNTCLRGWADETISSRAWRMQDRRRRWRCARIVIDWIFRAFGDREHCRDAYISERQRAHSPPEQRSMP